MTRADDPLAFAGPPDPGAVRWTYVAYAVAAALTVSVVAAFGVEPAPMPQPAGPVTFSELTAAAVADLAAVPAELRQHTRYLDARNLPAAYRREAFAVVSYHVNGLSSKVRITAPREVTPWLWALLTIDYGWNPKTWEKLRKLNFYHSIEAKVTKPVEHTDGKFRPAEVTDFIPAPHLPPGDVAALVEGTGSQTPIVRADLFVNITGVQEDREGAGYYDWFGFKRLSDVEEFVDLDREKAAEFGNEDAAIAAVSGVALQNRQLFRYVSRTGPWWESRDVRRGRRVGNAKANLLGDFKFDATEVVFRLPNGLPAYYLANGAGVQQNAAPDFIAADQRSTNNDRRVHAGYSCIACHVDGGLRPIRDWARKRYAATRGGFGSLLPPAGTDPKEAERFNREKERRENAYLGDLAEKYDDDAAKFGRAVVKASGLRPAELSAAYVRFWSRYLDEPVTLDRAAAEAGVGPDEVATALKRWAAAKAVVDPVLGAYLEAGADSPRREEFEERFPLLMLVLSGANP